MKPDDLKIGKPRQASDGCDVDVLGPDGRVWRTFHFAGGEPKNVAEAVAPLIEQHLALEEAEQAADSEPLLFSSPEVQALTERLDAMTAQRDTLASEKAVLVQANTKLSADLAAAKRVVR